MLARRLSRQLCPCRRRTSLRTPRFPSSTPRSGHSRARLSLWQPVATFGGSLRTILRLQRAFTVTENVQLTLTSSNPAITGLGALQQTLTSGQTYTGLAPTVSAPFGPTSPSNSVGPISFADLTPFVGTGTLPFNLATLTSTTFVGGGGNLMNSITTTAGGTETITYTYTAPPASPPRPSPNRPG